MTVAPGTDTGVGFAVEEVSGDDGPRVLEGYTLLKEALGSAAVEDLGSFWGTVSPDTDAAVVSKLVCASRRGRMIGFSAGAYLRNLNVGFIAYSAVREDYRRKGVYASMRGLLVSLFNWEASHAALFLAADGSSSMHPPTSMSLGDGPAVSYVISELDKDNPLYRRYIGEWKAFEAPCAYEQPAAQGLDGKQLKLVLQPMAKRSPPGEDETIAIVREVYLRIYRIRDVDENDAYRRVADSVRRAAIIHD